MRPSFDEIAELNALELCRPARMSYDEAYLLVGGTRGECPVCHHPERTLSLTRFDSGDAYLKCWSGSCTARLGDLCRALRKRTPSDVQVRAPRTASEKDAEVREILAGVRAPQFSMVDLYLRGRGIWMLPEYVYYHSNACGWGPSMVCKVVDVMGAITGVHLTWLERFDGHVIKRRFAEMSPKQMRGRIVGSAVKFGTPVDTVVLCEGVETGLSIWQQLQQPKARDKGLYKCPVWATLSTSGLKGIVLPRSIRRAVIAADNDLNDAVIAADNDLNDAGQEAAEAAAERLRKEYGIEVIINMPAKPGTDYNDLLLERQR